MQKIAIRNKNPASRYTIYGTVYVVHPTIISLGSWVSDFAGNLWAQKFNKAETKRANKTGVQYFCGLWYFTRINRSVVNFV